MLDWLQNAGDLFDPVANLNKEGIIHSFHAALTRVREQLILCRTAAQPGGSYEDMCFYFQVATCLVMSFLDGLAVYAEKKLAPCPKPGIVYWASDSTFIDPIFANIRAIQERTKSYIIKGGITANTLRNFAKHYLPWLPIASTDQHQNIWDIRFQIDSTTYTGPVLTGLLFPLFNDAREAYVALAALANVPSKQVHPL